MRKPRLNPNPGANYYAAPGERIAEFSFPEAASGSGDLPGGLIAFRYRKGKPPAVILYRVEGCEVGAPATPAHLLGEDVARLLREVPGFGAAVLDLAHREGCDDAWRQALAPLFPELDF